MGRQLLLTHCKSLITSGSLYINVTITHNRTCEFKKLKLKVRSIMELTFWPVNVTRLILLFGSVVISVDSKLEMNCIIILITTVIAHTCTTPNKCIFRNSHSIKFESSTSLHHRHSIHKKYQKQTK